MSIKTSDMCEGRLTGKILLYTIPIILTGILQLLFNAADLIVVGNYGGGNSVAAVGATLALINLIVNLFIGLSVGAGVSVAHGLGAGHDEDVSKTIHTAVPTAFISGIILTLIGVFGSEYFLTLMGTPDDVIGLSAIYMKIYFCGITSSMLYNFGAAILRAAGDTLSPLLFLTAAGIINVGLNLLFVKGFNMDVAGVALATSISQTISAVLVIIALIRRKDACKLCIKKLHIYKAQLLKIIRIGLPAGIQGSLFSISNVIIQSSVNSFGSVVMAGNAAAQNIEGFVYTSMNSFHQTALNFTGMNYGAGKLKRIPKIAVINLLSVSVTGILLGGGAYVFAKPLLSFYIDGAEPIKYGILRLAYICLPYFLCGIMDVSTGLIRGLGSSLVPMMISVLGVCGFRIFWIFKVFSIERFHTLECLYSSYIISWTITFLAQITVFIILYRKASKRASDTVSGSV